MVLFAAGWTLLALVMACVCGGGVADPARTHGRGAMSAHLFQDAAVNSGAKLVSVLLGYKPIRSRVWLRYSPLVFFPGAMAWSLINA